MEVKEKCAIWGIGKTLQRDWVSNDICKLIKQCYEIVAYCDSDESKIGTKFRGKSIISPLELKKLCRDSAVTCILITVNKRAYIQEIEEYINLNISDGIEVYSYASFIEMFINRPDKFFEYRWNIDFKAQVDKWVDHFIDEVYFWVVQFAKEDGIYHWDCKKRLENDEFLSMDSSCAEMAEDLTENSIVLDIGSGLLTKYGTKLPDSSLIRLIPIDPLAPWYNRINNVLFDGKGKISTFGMFEFMSAFWGRSSCDAIIINNALDHCIDPFKSIVECMYILKPGGWMHLNHNRVEALYEIYSGLHQWNIDYDTSNNLIFWNQDNALNVSEQLKEIAEIKVYPPVLYSAEHRNIRVEIRKKKEFSLEQFYDMEQQYQNLAYFMKQLMEWTARHSWELEEMISK